MTLAVGTKFTVDGKTYQVHRTPMDNPLASKYCDKRCAFFTNKRKCRQIIKITGDCQPRYRADRLPVHFKEVK